MTEDFEMTEEQRIQFELKKAEQKEKKKKRDRIIFLIIGLFLLSLIVWFVYDQMKPKSQRKPVIYLYPEETTGVEVTLNFAGKLTSTYPAYENGWKVTAEPDGTLTDSDGKVYNYLFWEGVADTEFDFSEGFCVKGSDTAEFLEDALARLGLTRREANEFIVYWLPLMEGNKYNIISFQGDVYTKNAGLTVHPNPDTVIRVFMAWYGSKKPVKIPGQELTAPERVGFTVVEWGGCEAR